MAHAGRYAPHSRTHERRWRQPRRREIGFHVMRCWTNVFRASVEVKDG